MCACLAPAAFAAEPALTIDAGWSVLVPASPTAYERLAAEKLQAELSTALGAEIPVVSEAAGRYIALGSASAADVSAVAQNGYRIRAIGGDLHIAGTGARGLQAGVYRFLEQFCGRKVYAPDLTEMPTAASISVPADTDVVYEPFFEYTETDWKTGNWEYSMANGLTGGAGRALPGGLGGSVYYLGGFCHTMGSLCETEAHKDTNPEQLALHNGERTTDQPCLTDPNVLAIATRNVLNILASGYDPNSLQIVSVTQNDNYNYCECDRCRAFEAAHGGVQSATMINFVNQIADAVAAAGYDNAAIDTFAYQYTRKAPIGIVPRDNVIVRLCTIECCFRHTLDDPACEQNVELMRDLHDWGQICDRIYIWDYTTNYSNTCIVFPDFNVIQRNIQVFYENHVKGVYEEGNYYIGYCDAEFGDLRAYMISKCLQDPYCDLDSEVEGFLAAFYGPGWQDIQTILDMHLAAAGGRKKEHLGIGTGPEQSMYFSDRQVAQIDALWEDAKDLAENETQLYRIERSELSWRFWKGSVNKGEFSLLNPGRFDEKQKLFEDLQAFGVMAINEGGYGDYLDCICVRYVPVNEWNMYEDDEQPAHVRLFFGKLLEKLTPLLTGFGILYRVVSRLNKADC